MSDMVNRSVMASTKLGRWLSAALNDPNVCDEMKADIREWFSAGEPVQMLCAKIAAIQGDAAPVDNRVSTSSPVDDRAAPETSVKLRDAVEVYQQAYVTWVSDEHENNAAAYAAAAAIIEQDRKAVRAEQAAEVAKWRDKYNELGQMALEQVSDLGTKLGRTETELDAAKADLQSANRELAKFKALAETLAGALGVAASCLSQCAEGLATQNDMETWAEDVAEALREYKEARDAS